MPSSESKAILITGGAQGIGRGIAERFLASPEAGFVTGQTLVVDGGMTRKMIYVEDEA